MSLEAPQMPPFSKQDAKAQAAAAKAYAKAQRNWFARHKILTGVGGLVVVGMIGGGIASGGGTNKPAANDQTNTIAPSNNTGSGSQAPAAAVNQPAESTAGVVLLSVSGNGTKQTQDFTAAGNWDLAYTYNCSKFGFQGNFMVDVYGSNGAMSFSNGGVNELGMSGSDVTHEHNGGTYYLSVNSECAWTIKVTSA